MNVSYTKKGINTLKNRAYSLLEIKSVSEDADERVIEGIATTPNTDRYGDVIESKGAKYTLPLPLLWQHDHDKPVGLVEFVEVTAKGIKFRARLAQVQEEGKLKERVDEAWQSLKSGLVRAVSIGFRPLEYEKSKKGDGLRFLSFDWLELSLVTIPANVDATISVIKKYDEKPLVVALDEEGKVKKATKDSTGASVNHKQKDVKSHKQITQKKVNKMTIQEQLNDLRTKRVEAFDQLQELVEKGFENLSDDESETFEELTASVESYDQQIERAEKFAKFSLKNATVLENVKTKSQGTKARQTTGGDIQLKNHEEKGMNFARSIQCLLNGRGSEFQSMAFAERSFQGNDVVKNLVRAAVEAGSTVAPNWASALVGEEATAYAEFVEWLRPQTLVGQFGTNGIPNLRRIGFRVPVINQSSGATGYWVGEGQAKPLTKAGFERTTFEPLKVANIAALTKESIAFSNPDSALLIRDELSKALITTIDTDFINPLKGAVAGVSPASILNGATAIVSSGVTVEDIRNDLNRLLSVFILARNPLSSAVYIMDTLSAMYLSGLRSSDLGGELEFPNLTIAGGTIRGIPVLVSDYVPQDTSGSLIALVNANDIFYADGAIMVDASEYASLEMSDTPTHNSTTPTGATSMVSMWQTNSVAFRAEKYLNWMRVPGRVGAAYISGVDFLNPAP